MEQAFKVTEAFERRIAEYTGAPFCVAVASGTWAIFLCLRLLYATRFTITLPARTFVSVAHAVLQAGYMLRLKEIHWAHRYALHPLPITDSALYFQPLMFNGGFYCLSFHARKTLAIGAGGAILCENEKDARELRTMRYCGRDENNGYDVTRIVTEGWNCYMQPRDAAYGLHLMEYANIIERPQTSALDMNYPDLRLSPYFQRNAECVP